METVEFKRQANNAPIIPLHGNDFFYIGMSLEQLNDLLWAHYSVYGEQQNDGFCMIYNILLDKSIRISIDILKMKVFRVEFLREYRGGFENIRIGSTIRDLLEIRDDIFFDEDCVLVGGYPYDYILKVDNQDQTIYSLDDILNNKVTSITVENKAILNF